MPARIEYKKGDKLGPYNIEFVEEVEPYVRPSGKKDRKGKFICPKCKTFFETRIDDIKRGHTKSCGCFQKEIRIENCKKRAKDLIGKRFGKLVVLEKTEKRSANGSIIWKCKCDCGKIIYVSSDNLISGGTKSCGCFQKEIRIENGKKRAKDLIGKRFGKLVVLEKTEKRCSGSVVWKCKCDCGNITYVIGANLMYGHTRSCGCNRESRGEEKVRIFLQSLNINFKTQKTFNKCRNNKTNSLLYFDFYLPDYNCCIEYDGEQHFEAKEFGFFTEDKVKEIQYRDNIKNQYCKDNNIKLIRIPYTEFDNIEEILTKELNL